MKKVNFFKIAVDKFTPCFHQYKSLKSHSTIANNVTVHKNQLSSHSKSTTFSFRTVQKCLFSSKTDSNTDKKKYRDKKVTSLTLTSKKRHGKKITMVTAYDYPSALHVNRAGIDCLLVGDSCAMVELGYPTTQPITVEELLHHCKAVKRAIVQSPCPDETPLLIGDLPFGSYEISPSQALQTSYRFIKEAGMDAVKLEGGSPSRTDTIRKIVNEGGIAVMGHVGLTPQQISVLGGFRAQGRTALRARDILDEALRLQDAGIFALVLECIPANVAKAITDTLEIPTIGIGAGPHCSGQVLVFHDMLGMSSHPHHEQFVPRFCKKYAQIGNVISKALEEFKDDVEHGVFPGQSKDQYSPYHMSEKEQAIFEELLKRDEVERQQILSLKKEELKNKDEYEAIGLYGSGNTENDKS